MSTLVNIFINLMMAAFGFQPEEIKEPQNIRAQILIEQERASEDKDLYKC